MEPISWLTDSLITVQLFPFELSSRVTQGMKNLFTTLDALLSIQTIAVLLTVSSCGKDNSGNQVIDAQMCMQERQEIDAAFERINYCIQDLDCKWTVLNPHYGCYHYHHKDADASSLQERVDAYSAGSCWDGSTTSCAPVDSLSCKAGRCVGTGGSID